ncbi:MAG TPA: acetate--CoA ligase family protein [Bacteroidales bacterium]|nr:acetate--CoA ligase family protein [Bacteroidales bacterium]
MTHKIVKELIDPDSIAIIGGSRNIHKPGGKILQNILAGNYSGQLYVVNPKEEEVQGVKSYPSVADLPSVDMAILAIPAAMCVEAVKTLISTNSTRAFIIISAGFSEENEEGARLEKELVALVEGVKGSLIGPNCIGVMTPHYQGVFTSPIPKLSPTGCDFISGSGATAVFIMESGIPKGLTFSSVFSVGNSAMLGVEDVLEYLDQTYDPETSSKVKILYIESVKDPDKLLKHASSLIRKGCRIAAIKSGGSEAGSRAASSHTGAIASSDLAVEALFRKAGIVRCFGREELSTVAGIFMHPDLKGKRIAIITHAGGPAVMLTDALSNGGLKIPPIEGPDADELLSHLYSGSSVSNPIDILATGTAEQLGMVIDYCEKRFENIDAMMVIFGSSGLNEVFDAYDVLHNKMLTCSKPIFPILPSVSTAHNEVESFLERGHINFPDEVVLGNALTKVYNTPQPADDNIYLDGVDIPGIRRIIDRVTPGYIAEKDIQALLDAAGIPRVREGVVKSRKAAVALAGEIGYPLVMKVVGPLHKSDVGGVTLNVMSKTHLVAEFNRMIKIKGCTGILLQPMLSGLELFLGAKYEPKFGHVVLCGLGGIFVEVIQDVSSGLAPLTRDEAMSMIRSLKSYKILRGARGTEGVDVDLYGEIIMRLSSLLRFATEIKEMDLNPLIGRGDQIHVVDSRIRVEK